MNRIRRVAALENARAERGPLLFSWIPAGGRAAIECGGNRYIQNPEEDRRAFLDRVVMLIPSQAVVWVDEEA